MFLSRCDRALALRTAKMKEKFNVQLPLQIKWEKKSENPTSQMDDFMIKLASVALHRMVSIWIFSQKISEAHQLAFIWSNLQNDATDLHKNSVERQWSGYVSGKSN